MKLLLVCSCRTLFDGVFKLVGVVNSEFLGIISSFYLSISIIISSFIGDGIDALILFVILFLFDLDWVVLSNDSIFWSEYMFLFSSILLFELIVSCRSESRVEFEFLFDFWALVFIEVTLSFMISLLILFFQTNLNFVRVVIFCRFV